MAPIVYIKSLFWLVAFGGLGYGLLQLTTPSQEKINVIKAKQGVYLTDEEKRKVLLMQKLKQATSETPIYLRSTKDKKD